MKELFINRHAKSSWSNQGLRDHDRPLNKRGVNDAPIMAKRLINREKSLDLIVSSSAVRALETAEEFSREFDLSILVESGIYEAGTRQLLKIINNLPDDKNKVMLFGHNPGFSYLVEYLCGYSLHIPTCGIVKVNFEFDSWSLVSKDTGRFTYFDFPKNTEKI